MSSISRLHHFNWVYLVVISLVRLRDRFGCQISVFLFCQLEGRQVQI